MCWLLFEEEEYVKSLIHHIYPRSKPNFCYRLTRQTLQSFQAHPLFIHPCFKSHPCPSLPAYQNFGLDYHTFQHMVGDCPSDFLQLAFNCCNVSPSHPSAETFSLPPPSRESRKLSFQLAAGGTVPRGSSLFGSC